MDLHCHLLAGLDDGPGSLDEAISMCRMAWEEGTRSIAATAHLDTRWPQSTPERILAGTGQLAARLREIRLPLSVYPSAEATIRPDMDMAWQRGELLGVAGRGNYVLIEMPMDVFVDARDAITRLRACGVRPILAHPERCPELLHDPGAIETLIDVGALVQATSRGIAEPPDARSAAAIRRWVQRGVVHLVGSDGHSADHRPPEMAAAYRRIASWSGRESADRICSLNGLAVLEGRPLRLPPPRPLGKSWFSFFKNSLGASRSR
ncbi:MAG: CpsB/CapC family capsule biosynthesis tyrosine phosphatase [Thermoguttaceae bacterium]